MRGKEERLLPIFLITLSIFLLALAATFCLWWYAKNNTYRYAQIKFDNEVRETRNLIRERLEIYVNALYGVQGLFAASRDVERNEWAAYLQKINLKMRYPGITAMRFIERVRADEKNEFIKRVRADTSLSSAGYPAFDIHPAGERAEYFVVKYVEPHVGNEKMFGFDIGSESNRRIFFESVRDTGEITATGRISFMRDSGKESGFLIFLPIYRNDGHATTLKERRAALIGYVDAAFVTKDLFAGIFSKKSVPPHIDFEIFDGETLLPSNLLYDQNLERLDALSILQGQFSKITKLTFAGRTWSLYFSSSPPQFGFKANENRLPILVILGGLVFALLLSGSFYSLAASRYWAISAAQQMTSDLRDSEERFRSVAESAKEAIISADHNGNIIFWNKGAETIFGYREREALGKPLTLIMPERYRERHLKGLERLHLTGQETLIGKTIALEGLKKDGTEFPIELSLSTWTTAKGTFYSGIIRDITDRKLAEEALHRAHEGLEIKVKERTYDLALTNETLQAEIIERRRLEEAVKKLNEDLEQRVIERTVQLATTNKKLEEEIIERKQAEKAIVQKTEELARAEAERQQLELFTYMASHDLQEPLQKIIAFGDILKERYRDALKSEGKEYLDRMVKSATRMSQLLDDLLQFSRVRKKEEALQPVDLEATIREVLSDLEMPLAESKGKVECGKLPAVKADPAQMHQLFQNLISNAVKFRKKDVLLRVVISSQIHNEHFTDIIIEDNGIGFDEKYKDQIFKPFERLHGRTEYEGTGIGLAICEKIALQYGGKISAKSVSGKGSTFTITLPLL